MKKPSMDERMANIEAFIASEQHRRGQEDQAKLKRKFEELYDIIARQKEIIVAKDATIAQMRVNYDNLVNARK